MLLFLFLTKPIKPKGHMEGIGQPEVFDTYLKALLAFTQHPSLVSILSFAF